MHHICELIKQKRLYFDGGMGTMLQKSGLLPGELPELWNLTHPDIIEDIHRQYLEAGANIITTNTFGVNCLKHSNYAELIATAIDCAQKARISCNDTFIAFDIGPIGRFLEPIGDLSFDEAVEIFAKNIRVADKCGVDLIIVETMTDSYETKAAVIAAKENTDLPIFVTNVYDENEKMLTGAEPEAMVAMLEGLGVSALGVNCSLGPDKMKHLIQRFKKCSSLPIIANPNAGLPSIANGKTMYSMTADTFAEYSIELAKAGASILGGCCGTEPEYVRETIKRTQNIPLDDIDNKNITVISSYTHAIQIDKDPILIGERINPTGKPKFKEALRNNDINYIIRMGLDQADLGVHILDVNVGLPDIDETELMLKTVVSLQSVCDLPLQLDSNNPKTLEQAMRMYNGKPLVNSVSGDEESMNAIFPLVKKYGGVVIALTLDKDGIPSTVSGRVNIAQRIIKTAKMYGIDTKDIIFDPLAMTISSNPESAIVTLNTVKALTEIGLKTSLGISNISFGLPNRSIINATFFTMALQNGLSCAIINPLSKELMDAYHSFRALANIDTACSNFINYSTQVQSKNDINNRNADYSLSQIIQFGLVDLVQDITNKSLEKGNPIDLINNEIIPALNLVGDSFQKGDIFLPQLLNSAEAASSAFEVLKAKMPQGETNGNSIILATVKGDVHDIGKNIVKLLLESYGFIVIDLGKNVPPETIVQATKKYKCKLVALSALMTTTLPAMEETIIQLKSFDSNINIIVGGAVLNYEYAMKIGADAYGSDAMSAVRYAQEFYSKMYNSR